MIERVNIQETLFELKQLLNKMEKAAALGPPGHLHYRRYANGTAVPYLVSGSREARSRKALDPMDRVTIEVLRNKTLAIHAIPLLKVNIAAMEAAKKYRDFNLYAISDALGPEFEASADLFLNKQHRMNISPAFDNLKERQNSYGFGPDSISTEFGLFRSKSEALEAEFIRETGSRFKYETMLYIGGKMICPDFVVDRPWRGDIGYIEHLGLIDRPDYREKKIEDIRTMMDHGIYPGINLLIISESRKDGFDAAMVRKLIHAFCMP